MMHYFLGMEVWQNIPGTMEVCNRDPEEGQDDGLKAMTTPMASNLKLLSDASSEMVDAMMYHQMIGSLMYLKNTRPYIFFAVNTLSQFLMDPRHVHLVAKHVVRYLKGTIEYDTNQKTNLYGYVEWNW